MLVNYIFLVLLFCWGASWVLSGDADGSSASQVASRGVSADEPSASLVVSRVASLGCSSRTSRPRPWWPPRPWVCAANVQQISNYINVVGVISWIF